MSIPKIETQRLLLREWRPKDILPFSKMNSDAEVMRYFPKTLSIEETEGFVSRIEDHWHQKGFGLWATELKSTHEFMGFIGLATATFKASFTPCVEIGWRLDKKFWNQGLATEGAAAVLDFGFKNIRCEQIFSFTSRLNLPSQRVMQKIGMNRAKNYDFEHPKIEIGNPLKAHVTYLKECNR